MIIERIYLLAGPPDNRVSIEVSSGRIILFVGPNNSGKSLALREIFFSANSPPDHNDLPSTVQARQLVQSLTIRWGSIEEMMPLILGLAQDVPPSVNDDTPIYFPNSGATVSIKTIRSIITERDEIVFRKKILGAEKLLISNGRSRFQSLEKIQVQSAKHHKNQSHIILKTFHHCRQIYEKINKLLKDAFDFHFVVDYSTTQWGIRLSRDEIPESIRIEKSYRDDVVKQMKKMLELEHVSDGVQQYLALVSQLYVPKQTIMILDEPEVFLHPPLVRQLGAQIAMLAKERGGHAVVSTHSPDFVLGVVQSGVSITLVRLGYRQGVSEVHAVDPTALAEVFEKPRLRSVNIVAALFAHGAIVTESENDLVLYEVARHYREEAISTGTAVHFVNGRQKQSADLFVGPLRRLGVPAVAVVDLDIIKEREPWIRLLKAACVPDGLVEPYANMRSKLEQAFKNSELEIKNGIDRLSGANKEMAEILIKSAKEYGIFIVPGGEIESWLKGWVDDSLSKAKRVTAILDALETRSPTAEEIRADIWDFVGDMVEWIRNPHRKGMRIEYGKGRE